MGINAKGVSAREAIGGWREDFHCFLMSIPFRSLVLPQHQGWVQRLHTSDGDRAHDTPRKSEFLPFVTSSLTFRRLEVNPASSPTRSHSASHQSFSITSARVDVAAPQALLPRLKSRQSAPNRPPLSKCKHLQFVNQTSLPAVHLSTIQPSHPGSAHARMTLFAAATGTATPTSRACLPEMASPVSTISPCYRPRPSWNLRSARA